MEGWIKLHRSIKNHWLYDNDMYFKAWITILLEVNHTDKKVLIEGELLECSKGESLNSIETWVKIFGKNWTRSRVRNFFKKLESDDMILTKGLRKTTKLIVVNYSDYQDLRPTENQQTTNKKPTKNQQKTTNKNVKNDKNVKNEKNNILICSISDETALSDYGKVAFAFWQLFKRNLIESGINKTNLDKVALEPWERETRLMIEKDGRTKEELMKIYNFLQTNDFWKKNILSIKNLRKQFEKLTISANNDKKQPNQYESKKQQLAAKYGKV